MKLNPNNKISALEETRFPSKEGGNLAYDKLKAPETASHMLTSRKANFHSKTFNQKGFKMLTFIISPP